MHVCVYIYVYMYACINARMYIYMYIYMHLNKKQTTAIITIINQWTPVEKPQVNKDTPLKTISLSPSTILKACKTANMKKHQKHHWKTISRKQHQNPILKKYWNENHGFLTISALRKLAASPCLLNRSFKLFAQRLQLFCWPRSEMQWG